MRALRRLPASRAAATSRRVALMPYARPQRAHGTTTPAERPLDTSNVEEVRAWAQKNFGSLKEATAQGESWVLQALNKPSVLRCIAEINATEFGFAKLDANQLKSKYAEQLHDFEASGRAVLTQDGVSSVIINHLHDIYKFRAAVPLWELSQAVAELGFLGGRSFRVTRRQLESHPTWRAVKLRTPFNSEMFHPAYDGVFTTNEEAAAANVKRFRGMRGAVNAFAKGLSAEQYDHLLKTVEKYSVTPAQHAEISKRVEEVRALASSKSGDLNGAVKRLFADYPMGTPQHQHLKELVAHDRLHDKTTALTYAATTSAAVVEPAAFKAKIDDAVKAAAAKSPEKKKQLEAFQQIIAHISKPEEQKKLRLLQVLAGTPLPDAGRDELLAPFADSADTDALLNDVLNAHPLAARLWGNRVAWLSTENIDYTMHYEEGSTTGLYKDVSKDPVYQEALKAPFFDSVTLSTYPFNSGLEEIHHIKLQALAHQLGFDLSSDLGIAQFDTFCHNYDISPGEATLDRVHDYPPPLHTYEELPIIKFAGWDEADVPEDYEEYIESQTVKH